MDKDGVYRPDRTIRDVYEDDTEAHKYQELGLSPYARIGSLAGDSYDDDNFKRPPKARTNLHAYTFVGPLVGETLSPADRLVFKPIYKAKPKDLTLASKLPGLIAAAIAYISRSKKIVAIQKSKRIDRYTTVGNAVPVFVSFIAVLLLVFAAVIGPDQPVSNPNGGGGQSLGGSSFSNPNIIDNRALFPLSIFSGNKHGKHSSGNNNGSSASNPSSTQPASPYKFVSPSSAQPVFTPSSTPATPSTSGVSVPSAVSQPTSSSPVTQPVSGSTSLPSTSTNTSLPSTSTPSGGGGLNLPSGSSSGGSVSVPSTGSGSGGLSVPGVTSPTSVSTPSTSVSSPVSSKPLIITSPAKITLN